MIINPNSLYQRNLNNSSVELLTAQLQSLPPVNLVCEVHKKAFEYICVDNNCQNKILCTECYPTHNEQHKTDLLACKDILGADLVNKIGQEIHFNIMVEQKSEMLCKFIEQVDLAITEIKKRIEKTLNSLFQTIKTKISNHCVEPLYPTKEWERLKKSLLKKKISLANANAEEQKKHLDEYVKIFSIGTLTLMDAENLKDIRTPVEAKEIISIPSLEQELVDETIKNMRKVLENFSSKLLNQIPCSNTPEENIQRTRRSTPTFSNGNSTHSPYFLRSPLRLTSNKEPSSVSSLSHSKEKVPEKVLENNAPTTRYEQVVKIRSIEPEESFAFQNMPPFLYDEYLETEVLNLPYVGPIKMEDGTTYKGQMLENKRHGKGKQIWKDGRFYEGYFKNNHLEGKGRMVHPDKDVYEGYWKKDKANGKGRYTKVDGWVYEGEWLDDQPHGKGREIWPDGSTYEGEFYNGVKTGKGTLIGPDGSCYCGDFKENLFDGEGKYIWIDGRQYQGRWVANYRHGKGTMYWPDGKKYDGEFVRDKRNGFGRFEWGDGRKYVGCWKDGKQHGQGRLHTKNGRIIDGEWNEGKFVENIAAAIKDPKKFKSVQNEKLISPKIQKMSTGKIEPHILIKSSPLHSPTTPKDILIENLRANMEEHQNKHQVSKESEDATTKFNWKNIEIKDRRNSVSNHLEP